MKNLFKSKLFLGAVCILLAAAVAFVGIPALNRTKTATRQVLKLRADVPEGTVLTAAMLTSAEVGAYGLPEGLAEDLDAAVGTVAGADLYAGELLWLDRLVPEEEYRTQENARSLGLTRGLRLTAVRLPSASAGIAGVLRAGDTVDVYEYVEEKNEDGEEIRYVRLVQGSMVIHDVLNNALESLTSLDEQLAAVPEGEEAPSLDFVPAYVIFRCSAEESRELIRLENTKTLHLVLRKTGAGG